MISISELKPIEIPFYRNIFNQINDFYGSFEGIYYKVTVNGDTYILHRTDNCFNLFDTKTGKREIFTIDSEYNIQGLILDGMSFRYLGGDLIARDIKSGISSNLTLFKRVNGKDIDGYSGLAIYSQYDEKKDMRVIYTYQHMYNQDERIYDMHLQKPFTIFIEDNVTKAGSGEVKPQSESFIKGDYDLRDEPIGFSLATIKDFGLIPFMKNGSYSLQKQDKITRYYKILGQHKDNSAITLFPLCRQYKIEELNERVKQLGFGTEVPELLLNIYNRDERRLNRFVEIINEIKAIELDQDNKSFGYKISE